jgi:hypothetical protein
MDIITTSFSILIGVISGVFTSLLIWFIKTITVKILIPWYQIKIYRGVDLSGDWKGYKHINSEISDQDEITDIKVRDNILYKLSINQTGHKLNGVLNIENKFPEEIIITTNNIIGEVQDHYVKIHYEKNNKNQIGFGTFLLKIQGSGDFFIGHVALMDGNGVISSYPVVFSRKNKTLSRVTIKSQDEEVPPRSAAMG